MNNTNLFVISLFFVISACAQVSQQECAGVSQSSILDSSGIYGALGLIKNDNQIACERRYTYIKSHPNINARTRSAIVNGKVFVGMTANEVIGSWGMPYSKNIYDAGRSEQWVYGYYRLHGIFASTDYIYLEKDIVVDWSSFGY